MTRKKAREEAFFLIFEYSFHSSKMDEIILKTQEYRRELDTFTTDTALGVEKNLEKIDEVLSNNLSGWSKNRISKVSLAILRLSLYELLYNKDVPSSVSINEAIELGKKYADNEDPAFINGVLASVNRKLGSDGLEKENATIKEE